TQPNPTQPIVRMSASIAGTAPLSKSATATTRLTAPGTSEPGVEAGDETKICPNCNKANPPSSRSCKYCGGYLSSGLRNSGNVKDMLEAERAERGMSSSISSLRSDTTIGDTFRSRPSMQS